MGNLFLRTVWQLKIINIFHGTFSSTQDISTTLPLLSHIGGNSKRKYCHRYAYFLHACKHLIFSKVYQGLWFHRYLNISSKKFCHCSSKKFILFIFPVRCRSSRWRLTLHHQRLVTVPNCLKTPKQLKNSSVRSATTC